MKPRHFVDGETCPVGGDSDVGRLEQFGAKPDADTVHAAMMGV
jgi:hypothetical protein